MSKLVKQSQIDKRIESRVSGNQTELNRDHWVFLLALVNQNAFQGTQLEIAFEIKQIIQSKIQGNMGVNNG